VSFKRGCGVVSSGKFSGGVEVGLLTTLGVEVRFFVRLRLWVSKWIIFLQHTPKLGIPVEMVQFLLKLLLKQISCCAPRFALILQAKFHSLYVKESESEILERLDILPPTPQPLF